MCCTPPLLLLPVHLSLQLHKSLPSLPLSVPVAVPAPHQFGLIHCELYLGLIVDVPFPSRHDGFSCSTSWHELTLHLLIWSVTMTTVGVLGERASRNQTRQKVHLSICLIYYYVVHCLTYKCMERRRSETLVSTNAITSWASYLNIFSNCYIRSTYNFHHTHSWYDVENTETTSSLRSWLLNKFLFLVARSTSPHRQRHKPQSVPLHIVSLSISNFIVNTYPPSTPSIPFLFSALSLLYSFAHAYSIYFFFLLLLNLRPFPLFVYSVFFV